MLNNEDNVKSIREEYQSNLEVTKENMKRGNGGMLNSIGSYNYGSNQPTFGLGRGSSFNNSKKNENVFDDSDSDEEIKTQEILNKNKLNNANTHASNLLVFDEIFSSGNSKGNTFGTLGTFGDKPSTSKVDHLSMNELFSSQSSITKPSSHANPINDIVFDFTKK